MFEYWDNELTPEETERLLDKAAAEVRKRKLQVPAILALEMHKPLAYVAGTAATVFAPFLVPMLGYDTVHDYTRVLSKRANIETLLRKLESDPTPLEAVT